MASKTISNQIRAEVVNKARNGVSVATLAGEYALGTTTIYKWLKAEINRGCSCSLQTKINKLQAENQALLKIIGRYRADEISKKR